MLKGNLVLPLRKQTQHITNYDLYASNPLVHKKALSGMESSCNPLGFGGGVSFSEHVTPLHRQEKVLTLADQLTQRYDDVPDGLASIIVIIYCKQVCLGCKYSCQVLSP